VKQANLNDVIGIVNQIAGLVPKLMALVGFVLLVVLLVRAAKTWRTLSTMELAGIVIAFALVGGAR
jgi:integral membrane sensor domain MASE1